MGVGAGLPITEMNILLQNLSGREALALTIIGEARGEPIEGQVAVGCVIRNRLHNEPEKYKSYNDVVFARLQFSCWNLNDPNYPKLLNLAMKLAKGEKIEEPRYRQCFWVAQGIINWDILDVTKGSLNYITRSLWDEKRPEWAKNAKIVTEKGAHVFFTA